MCSGPPFGSLAFSATALFTGVRGRGILGSLYPAVCKQRLLGSTVEPFAPLLCIEANATCVLALHGYPLW